MNYYLSTIPDIQGKRVCVWSNNSYHYAVNCYGVMMAGGVIVPMNQRKSWDELHRELELEPCLLLGMRLGEGSGCPLLFRILQGACAVLDGMATFPEAAIEDEYLTPIRQGDAFTVDKS